MLLPDQTLRFLLVLIVFQVLCNMKCCYSENLKHESIEKTNSMYVYVVPLKKKADTSRLVVFLWSFVEYSIPKQNEKLFSFPLPKVF